jgi:hypothetical protein
VRQAASTLVAELPQLCYGILQGYVLPLPGLLQSTLLPKVQAGETNGQAVAGPFQAVYMLGPLITAHGIEQLWPTLLPKMQAG